MLKDERAMNKAAEVHKVFLVRPPRALVLKRGWTRVVLFAAMEIEVRKNEKQKMADKVGKTIVLIVSKWGWAE